MNPQILGNLTAVAQKTAQAQQSANTAQQMAANAQKTATSNATAISALQTVTSNPVINLLSPFVAFTKAELTLDGAWHTLSIPGVPSTATFLYVGGYVQNEGGPGPGGPLDNARQKMWVRPNSAGQQMLMSLSNGVFGSYEDDQPFPPCVTPSNGPNIDYMWTASVTDTNFVVYGYI